MLMSYWVWTSSVSLVSKIDCKKQTASPAQEYCTSLILDENIKIPAAKSRVFLVSNTLPGLTLFEPGANLPEGLLGVSALGQGSKISHPAG